MGWSQRDVPNARQLQPIDRLMIGGLEGERGKLLPVGDVSRMADGSARPLTPMSATRLSICRALAI